MPVDGLSHLPKPQLAPIADRLLAHYDRSARRLPWRAPPGAPAMDPYRVWLSEIMLQQTTVAAVIPYFERFTRRWPDVAALAAAEDADLMAAWAGLGYYARARNLLACARTVAGRHGGAFPSDEAGLLALPGIGAYTAAAIAAIAFGRRAVVIDGNVERVIARLAAIETPLPAAKAEIRAIADELTPDARAGDFAQAMMDLGATICTPRNPACGICPLMAGCRGRETGDPARFPIKATKRAKPHRHGIAWWAEAEGHVWLVRRPDKGLLGGMRALPSSEWTAAGDLGPAFAIAPPLGDDWRVLDAPVRHVFTHFSLDLAIHCLSLPRRPAEAKMRDAFGPGEWWPTDRIGDAGLPSLFFRAAEAALTQYSQAKAAA